jgi:hypothetical protein
MPEAVGGGRVFYPACQAAAALGFLPATHCACRTLV